MDSIDRNQFTHGRRNTFGRQFVMHQTGSGKSIIASKPLFDENPSYAETGSLHQAAIRDAGTYASFAQTQDVYLRKAEEAGTTPYTLAVADWYGAPRVLQIDVDNWTGRTGEIIRVKAKDNVCVARVTVIVRDARGEVLEMGEAVQSKEGSSWWDYITQASVPLTPFPTLQAIAFDLPGNRDSFIIS